MNAKSNERAHIRNVMHTQHKLRVSMSDTFKSNIIPTKRIHKYTVQTVTQSTYIQALYYAYYTIHFAIQNY